MINDTKRWSPVWDLLDQEIAFYEALLLVMEREWECLKKACVDFESIFIQQILKSMRQTVLRSDLFGKGTERDIFESLLDQEWSKGLARRGMGLGRVLYQQLERQGKVNHPDRRDRGVEENKGLTSIE